MKTGDKVRVLRLTKNMRQRELSRHAAVPITVISAIETDMIAIFEQRLLAALDYRPELDPVLEQLACKPALPQPAAPGRPRGRPRMTTA